MNTVKLLKKACAIGRIGKFILAVWVSAAFLPADSRSESACPWQREERAYNPWRMNSEADGAGSPLEAWRAAKNNPLQFSALGVAVEMDGDKPPLLIRRGFAPQSSRRRTVPGEKIPAEWRWTRDNALANSLGPVLVGKSAYQGWEITSSDWSGAAVEYAAADRAKLQIWIPRLSPAILFHTDSDSITFLQGAGPKFLAWEADGKVTARPAGPEPIEPGTLDSIWVLVWFGGKFASSKFSTYYRLFTYAADCPLLFVFGRAPDEITCDESGLTASLAAAVAGEGVGYVAVLPLFGDNYPAAAPQPMPAGPVRTSHDWGRYGAPTSFNTASWSAALPEAVIGKCRWWAKRLLEFPVSASETYSYDPESDTTSVAASFDYVSMADGGIPFAPLPPMLALAAEQGFPIEFSTPFEQTGVLTAHGPYAGIDNARSWTWRAKGMGQYLRMKRLEPASGPAPTELLDELHAQVKAILDAGGDLAPWYPPTHNWANVYEYYHVGGHGGDFLFSNPAETITCMAECFPVLDAATQAQTLKFVRELRARHPPWKLKFLMLNEGKPRTYYPPVPEYIAERQNDSFKKWNFWLAHGRPPCINLYHLARYCELTGDIEDLKNNWSEIRALLEPCLHELDWGTMGFFRRPTNNKWGRGLGGVIDINDFFAACLGGARLADMAGDADWRDLCMGLFARTAALRFAMAKYKYYLYENELLRLPAEKDWMWRFLPGTGHGYLYTSAFCGPADDIQEIFEMDQFGVHFREDRPTEVPGLLMFCDPVPELGLLFKNHLVQETKALLARVNEVMPAWWTTYCEAEQTHTAAFQPPEDAHQLFLLHAWVLDETPERLAWLRDAPWLKRGDLFYIQKLSEAVRAFGKR